MARTTSIKNILMQIKNKLLIDYKLINIEVNSIEELEVIEKDLLFRFESSTKPSIYNKLIVVKVKNTGDTYKYKVVKEGNIYYIVAI